MYLATARRVVWCSVNLGLRRCHANASLVLFRLNTIANCNVWRNRSALDHHECSPTRRNRGEAVIYCKEHTRRHAAIGKCAFGDRAGQSAFYLRTQARDSLINRLGGG